MNRNFPLKESIFFVLLMAVFFHSILFTKKTYFTGDMLAQFHPWRAYAARQIREGSVPLWNPYSYGGMPSAANMQSAVFYPPNLLFAFLPFAAAYKLYILLHIFFAWLFAFLLLREIGAESPAAFLAGTVFALNGYTISRALFLSVLGGSVWLPAEFLLLIKALKKQRTVIFTVLLGIIFSLQFFAGHPQVVLYSGLFLTGFAVYDAVARGRFKAFRIIFVSVLLSLFIGAVQLLPSLELALRSVRGGGLDLGMLSLNSLNFKGLLNFINPFFRVAPEWAFSCYVGGAALVLAVLSFLRKKENMPEEQTMIRNYSVAALAVSVLWALGSNALVSGFFYRHFSVFRFFRFPATALFLAVFSISILAGMGYGRVKSLKLRILFFLVLTVELTVNSGRLNPTVTDKVFDSYGKKISFLMSSKGLFRFILTKPTDDDRKTSDLVQWRDALHGNVNLCYGLFNAAGEDPLRLAVYSKFLRKSFLNTSMQKAAKLFSLINVRYVLSKDTIKSEKYRLIIPGKVKLYENTGFMNRAFFVTGFVTMPRDKILSYMTGVNFKPSEEIVLEGDGPTKSARAAGIRALRCRILQYAPERVLVNVDNENNGWLVLSDVFYPGWKCFVDGRRAKILKADYLIRAVKLSPGKHIVCFTYQPCAYLAGRAITLLSFILLPFFLYIYINVAGTPRL